MRIERWDGEQALDRSAEIWPVYERVFDRHCARRQFRLVAAFDDESGDAAGGRVVGFAYGYVGDRGQYWPDRVASALGDDIAVTWVGDHFEFVELAVVEGMRRRGVGSALHDALMTDPPVDRALLSTDDDPQSPAVRLYRSRGWERLTLLEPGVQVMGLRL
jgi:ribosomal protein S18 acetylase RimI-like enzyme